MIGRSALLEFISDLATEAGWAEASNHEQELVFLDLWFNRCVDGKVTSHLSFCLRGSKVYWHLIEDDMMPTPMMIELSDPGSLSKIKEIFKD